MKSHVCPVSGHFERGARCTSRFKPHWLWTAAIGPLDMLIFCLRHFLPVKWVHTIIDILDRNFAVLTYRLNLISIPCYKKTQQKACDQDPQDIWRPWESSCLPWRGVGGDGHNDGNEKQVELMADCCWESQWSVPLLSVTSFDSACWLYTSPQHNYHLLNHQ